MCPQKDDDAEQKPTARSWNKTNPQAAAAYRRRYREAHPEKIAALHRAWRERNRERSRELNRESAQRQAHRRRLRLKHNAHGREWYAEHRDVALERSRRFRTEHPDKIREYQRRYKERHPERARQNSRLWVQRHRDANADAIRERQRLEAAARKRENPDIYKQWYAANVEKQRARGREASRLRSRLKKLGQPPRHVHRVYANERREHDAAADAYFARRRSMAERGTIAAEASENFPLDLPDGVAKRRGVALRVQSAPLESGEGESLVSGQDRGLPPEVFMWRRARDIQALKESHDRLVAKINAERPQIFDHHRARREALLREEIRMDSIARSARGLPYYDVDHEMEVRLNQEVTAIVNRRLVAMRDHTIERGDAIVRRHSSHPDAAAPHRPPGSGPNTGARLQ